MLQDPHHRMHGYLVGCPLVLSLVQRTDSFCVACLPVPVQAPVPKPEVSADVTLLALPVLRPVTVTQFSRRVTIIKRIGVSLVVRVPAPSAVVFVIILVAAGPRIMGHFWEGCPPAAEIQPLTQVPGGCLYALPVLSRVAIVGPEATVVLRWHIFQRMWRECRLGQMERVDLADHPKWTPCHRQWNPPVRRQLLSRISIVDRPLHIFVVSCSFFEWPALCFSID